MQKCNKNLDGLRNPDDDLDAQNDKSKHEGRQYCPFGCRVCEAARRGGRTDLFTPPRHGDLQPIKLTSARNKGNVGRQ